MRIAYAPNENKTKQSNRVKYRINEYIRVISNRCRIDLLTIAINEANG